MSEQDQRAAAERAVKSCYSTWAGSYHADYYAGAGAYPPVHQDVIRNLVSVAGARTLLDAGCGPASMLRSLTDLGLELYGFDLTPEMVQEARRVMAEHGAPPANFWEGSVADPAAFRGPASAPRQFDAAICIGVLPHVPESVEQSAIANLRDSLGSGGVVAIEARNQLFGLFSLNRYSYDLFTKDLMPLEALRQHADADPAALSTVLTDMQRLFRMDLPPIRGGTQGEPGYDEVLSRTHNPFVLKQEVAAAGFTDVTVLFYHYHCLPPMFEKALPQAYRALSVAMEDPTDWRGHFMASAFIVTGKKV